MTLRSDAHTVDGRTVTLIGSPEDIVESLEEAGVTRLRWLETEEGEYVAVEHITLIESERELTAPPIPVPLPQRAMSDVLALRLRITWLENELRDRSAPDPRGRTSSQ